ncbi:deoxyribonuclease-1-like [Penaeus japonicus]|uniref:deoxyribonuclease-1-like n=1 Tax=Penaeus japonicus TaxID=27405 RepID=UPI001C70FF9B|nr:deoxyribonuclease-1-like [Penaeus japonicus]
MFVMGCTRGQNQLALVLLASLAGAIWSTGEVDIETPLRIGAWNLQRLGKTKMSKHEVVSVIVQVLRRYDVVAALEVRDVSEETPRRLLDALNKGLTDTYDLSLSERVGRSRYKEQYAIYYKPSRVTLVSAYQYPDTLDVFEYEPYVVVFEDSNLLQFGTVFIHTKPSDAVEEVDALVDVYEDFRALPQGVDDVIILGDFNAGCDYVSGSDWDDIRLRHDPRFKWLITDHVDTTVRGTTCPYDRIVVSGPSLQSVVYSDSAEPYYFEEELGLQEQSLIEDVSDHYPVEVRMRGSVAPRVLANVTSNVGTGVTFLATAEGLANITVSEDAVDWINVRYFVFLRWIVDNLIAAKDLISCFASNNSLLVPFEAVSVLLYKLDEGALTDPTLYGADVPLSVYTITLLCTQASCTFSVTAPTLVN